MLLLSTATNVVFSSSEEITPRHDNNRPNIVQVSLQGGQEGTGGQAEVEARRQAEAEAHQEGIQVTHSNETAAQRNARIRPLVNVICIIKYFFN